MNIQNVKRTLNLFIRKQLKGLKLEANVNGMKKVKSELSFSSIFKKKRSVKGLIRKLEVNGKEICHQAKTIDEMDV